MLSESPHVRESAINFVRQVGIARCRVRRSRTAQSSTWAPTTNTFNFRWGACAWLASDITELIASGTAVLYARPSIESAAYFFLLPLLVLLSNPGRFGDHSQPVYIKLFVQVEAKKIRSGFEFDRRIQKVLQARHPSTNYNFGE